MPSQPRAEAASFRPGAAFTVVTSAGSFGATKVAYRTVVPGAWSGRSARPAWIRTQLAALATVAIPQDTSVGGRSPNQSDLLSLVSVACRESAARSAPIEEAAAAPAQAGSVVGPVELTTAHPSKQWAASRKEAFCTNIGVGVTFLGIGCLLLLMTETAIAHIAGILSFCIAAYAALLILLQGNRAPDWEEAWRKFYYFLDWFREVLRKK